MELQNENRRRLCRLCISLCDDNCKIIDDVIKIMLETLLLTPDPSLSGEPVICKKCVENVDNCVKFKYECLHTEDIINSVTGLEKLDIKDIFLKKQCSKNKGGLPEDHTVCRLCLELVKCDGSISLKEWRNEDVLLLWMILNQFLPEINMKITNDPIVCKNCQTALLDYLKFTGTRSSTKNCDAEIKSEAELSIPVGLPCIYENDGKTFPEAESGNIIQKSIVKTQVSEIKREEVEIKEEPSDVDSQPTNQKSNGTAFQCSVCPFKTPHQHLDKHKDLLDAPMHSCVSCSFKTKYKASLKRHSLNHLTVSTLDFKCKYCDFKTKYLAGLKSHENSVYERPRVVKMYQCDACDYKTTHSGKRDTHKLAHLIMNKVKTYRCPLCAFKTKHKTSIKNHLLVHVADADNINSDTCEYEAEDLRILEKQELTCCKKEYRCSRCTFVTKHSSSLARHKGLHKDRSEVKIYKCASHVVHSPIIEACEFETRHYYSFLRHLRVEHGIVMESKSHRGGVLQVKRRTIVSK